MRRVLLALFLNCLLLPGAGNVYLGLRRGWIQGLIAAPCIAVFCAAASHFGVPEELRLPLPKLSGWVWTTLAVWCAVTVWALAEMVAALVEEAKRCRESSSQGQTQGLEKR